MSINERIAQELKRQGVRAVFTLMSEDTAKLIVEVDRAGIPLYSTRHDSTAVGMADGYARASGEVGVAIVGWLVLIAAWVAVVELQARSPGLALALMAIAWVNENAASTIAADNDVVGNEIAARREQPSVIPEQLHRRTAAGRRLSET